jgi:hypothetical protein
VFFAGCVSTGSEGLIMKSSADPVAFLKTGHSVKDLGFAEGQACRYFAIAVVPFGNSDIQRAVDKALEPSGGDALVNVASSTSLYGFVPVYNVFSFTCTTVKGTAVKFDGSAESLVPPTIPGAAAPADAPKPAS